MTSIPTVVTDQTNGCVEPVTLSLITCVVGFKIRLITLTGPDTLVLHHQDILVGVRLVLLEKCIENICTFVTLKNLKKCDGHNFQHSQSSDSICSNSRLSCLTLNPHVSPGPTDDHTYQNGTGHYFYTEVSLQGSGDVARIMSPVYSQTSRVCKLQFYYWMQGDGIGKCF